MTAAPDFVEAVVGYRAWHVGDDGALAPWSFPDHPWVTGVNDAVCLRHPRHAPPVPDCMCGLYALTDPSDRRLCFGGDQAVGAVAAWGDMEVHRTGFRARHACVVALAVPDAVSDEQLERLERAAARYGVALVPALALSAEARRHGAPLPDLWGPAPGSAAAERDGRAVPAVDSATFAAPARGVAVDAHVWVETALGAVVLGVTRQLGEIVAPGVPVLPEPGDRVAAGDRLATIPGDGGPLAVWAPVGGRVLAVNPRVAAEPALLRDAPEGAGWLVRLAPDAWEADASSVTWGRAAARTYASTLARDAAFGDPFADVRLERLRALPPVRSWQDVLGALRSERRRGRFPDGAALEAHLVGRLRAALVASPPLCARLARLDARVAWRVHDPEATVLLDLRDGGACIATDPAVAAGADLELRCSGDTLYRWATGTLDVAGALRRGELVSDRPATATLRALAVLKHLRVEPWAPAPSWAA